LANPRVPRALERICLKALAPDPDHRYRSAGEFERALQGYLQRPRMVAAGASVLGLAALTFLALRSRPDRSEPTPGQASAAAGRGSPLAPAAAPWIVSFEVNHFRGDKPPIALGTIGKSPGPILLDDDVRVQARLSGPAYSYLIALNPDGKIRLCHPAEDGDTPLPSDEIGHPTGNLYFPLNDGTGLQAFVLVASREPLPPFAAWEGRRALHWEAVPADSAGTWGFDGLTFEPLTVLQRGAPREHSGPPRPFQEVCEYVKKVPGIDAVRAIAFPVRGQR
jgi:hypothetical protein